MVNGATPSLKLLSQKFLGIEIQSGEHSSVRVAYNIFCLSFGSTRTLDLICCGS